MLSNFLFRVRQYLHENRVRVVKVVGIVIAAGAIALLIIAGVEKIQRARYEKRVQALDQQIRDAEQKAADAEGRAAVIQSAIESKNSEIQFLQARAATAEARMRDTKAKVITLKEQYETVRYVPLPNTPVSCESVCRDLAAVGYACK